VRLLFANTFLQGIVGNCIKIVITEQKQYWNFIRITFVPSVNKKKDKMWKE